MNSRKLGANLVLVLRSLKIIADVALWAAIIALLILFGLEFPHSRQQDSLWLVQRVRAWGDPALSEIATIFGWSWPTTDISLLPIGTAFVLLAAKQGWDTLLLWLIGSAPKQPPLQEKAQALSSSDSSMGISVSSTLIALAAVSEKAREKIQRRHARVASLLSGMKHRQCTFLAIDVVDAEKMREGMPPEVVTRSFSAYEEMLEEVFQLTHPWKEAWMPDGVMVCYLDARQALEAGQRVLKGLEALNAGRNELREPFRVRCGLNEGEVVIFEDSKLEKVADHVIDVAVHMQKRARPNSLWLSSKVYDHLEEKGGFHPVDTKVDELAVFEWRAA